MYDCVEKINDYVEKVVFEEAYKCILPKFDDEGNIDAKELVEDLYNKVLAKTHTGEHAAILYGILKCYDGWDRSCVFDELKQLIRKGKYND